MATKKRSRPGVGTTKGAAPLVNQARTVNDIQWPERFADLKPQLAADPTRNGERLFAWLLSLPQVRWPESIALMDSESRTALVLHLCHRGFPLTTIADQLALPHREISELWRSHCELRGREVINVSLPGLVGHIDARAEELVHRAMQADQGRLAWQIERERVELLQDLGIVERAVKRHEVEVHHTLGAEDLNTERRSEIQRILDLEERKKKNQERAQKLRIEVGAVAPEDSTIEDVEDQ